MKSAEICKRFLEYFEKQGHKVLPSAPLIPRNDPTLLLVGAGMVPFKPYFLGKEIPESRRVTTCQRCVRTADIENVGRTARHGTFFEMLGNFSFGDYFKQEAIRWAWDFITNELGLEKDRLWITIYLDDDEAFALWQKEAGLPEERIVRMGKKDNFWEIGVGPCGPCSEIIYDRGPEYGCGREDCFIDCECDRYLEIWNLVFIQFYRDEQGNYTPLENRGIDTGMGLDRIACVLQDVPTIFDIDITRPVVDLVAELARVEYGKDEEQDSRIRQIADHARAITFMVSDGILPSNEGRGYILRRLLRRAVRYGKLLGIAGPFLKQLAQKISETMGSTYPELRDDVKRITSVISREEERFNQTLDQGTAILEELIAKLKQQGKETIPGEQAFRLYDTYGFPLELTAEIASERGYQVDRKGFEKEMERQRLRARSARGETGYLDADADTYVPVRERGEAEFVGYDTLTVESEITALLKDGQLVDSVQAGEKAEVCLVSTPFYPESGGQVGDSGLIKSKSGAVFKVEATKRPVQGVITHLGVVEEGSLKAGDRVIAEVDEQKRSLTARNHSATHLLHKALHEVLGGHANQAGSLVEPFRLRFDFTHDRPLTNQQLAAVEEKVNKKVLAALPVKVEVMRYDEAVSRGAVALFGEKYGDTVRVVSMGDYSKELCGGTHVKSTGELGLFAITSESSVGTGIRRIEAVTSYGAYREYQKQRQVIENVADCLKVGRAEVGGRLESLLEERKELESELARQSEKLALYQGKTLAADALPFNGFKVVAAQVDAPNMDVLRRIGDMVKSRIKSGVVVLGTATGKSSVSLIAMVSDDLADWVHAGKLVKRVAGIVGGGGGGRPTMAQAGGKNPEKLEEALAQVKSFIETALAGEI